MEAPDRFAPSIAGTSAPERPGRDVPLLALVLCAGAFLVVLAGVPSTFFELERHAVPKELALHGTALLCLCVLLPGWRRVTPGIVEALFALFVVWSAGSSLFAANRWLALGATGISFSGLVLFLAARRVARSESARRFALAGLAAAATCGAALGVAQAYGFRLEWLVEDRPPGGTFGNRNFLAHFLVIAAPPVLLAALRARKRAPALLASLALLIMVGAIVLTRSRAAWLALLAALFVVALAALFGRRAHRGLVRRRRLVPAALVVLAAGLLAALLPNRLEWRSDSPYFETLTRIADYGGGSGRGRLIQWRNSMALFAAAPVHGVGPGNWFVQYPRVTEPGDPSFAGGDPIPTNPWPSSDWVAILVERGAVGALLLLMTGLAAATVAVRRIVVRQPMPFVMATPDFDNDAAQAARAIAALGVITAAFVAGLFDAVLLLAAPTFFAWTTLGLLLPATRPVSDRPLTGRARRIVVGVTAAASFGLAGYGALRLASLLVVGDRPDRARLEAAARLDPGSHRVRLRLARLGRCADRIDDARAAARLMPHHPAPRRALRACGIGE